MSHSRKPNRQKAIGISVTVIYLAGPLGARLTGSEVKVSPEPVVIQCLPQ